MKTELRTKESLLSATRALQDSMQSFFHGWIKNGELQKEWNKHKETARDKIEKFLQEDASIFFQAKNVSGSCRVEQIIKNLEDLEKAQLGQRFLTANTHWNCHDKKQEIILPQIEGVNVKVDTIEPALSETMIFMPDTNQNKNLHIDVTDILRKGLTNLRALLNMISLSEKSLDDEKFGELESHLCLFKKRISIADKLHKKPDQNSPKEAMKSAVKAYQIFLNKLAETLVKADLYVKKTDARQGIVYMADFLWSKNDEKSSIYIQNTSEDQTNILVFEPRSVKGSGKKEALWIQKIAKKHPWIKKLPWQVLERPRPSMNRDGEGLKIEKATLVSVKKTRLEKTKEAAYIVDCMPMGELGGTPVPFAICDLVERYRITLENQKSIFLGSQTRDDRPPFRKLEEVIYNQIHALEGIMTKERRKKGIIIPLADISFTQRILPFKGSGLLQDRADANKVVRQILQRYMFYYDARQIECIYLDKQSEDFKASQEKFSTENYIPIYVAFHYPTVVYNNFKVFSYRTNEDVIGLKISIKIAIERLEIFKEKLFELSDINKIGQQDQDIEDIGQIQKFLQSRSVGVCQSHGIPDSVISAARRLCEKLRDARYPLLDDACSNRKIQIALLKILQSSLIVKDESFESVFGFLRRIIDNFFIGALFITPENKCARNFLAQNTQFSKTIWGLFCLFLSPLFVIGWSARLLLTSVSAILKIPSGIFYGLQNMMGKTQNKSARLAAAVGILFSATGKKKLNFKSTVDCALPVFFVIYAMINRAIHGEPENGRVPLMTECNKWTFSKDTAGATIRHRQVLKMAGC